MSCDQELYGRQGDLSTIRRQYHVPVDPDSTTPEADVLEWVVNNTPGDISGFKRANAELEEYDERLNEFEVIVEWTATGATPVNAPPPAETDSAEYRFNFMAQGGHRRQSLQTLWGRNIYDRDFTHRFKKLVNVVVQDNDGPSDAEGVDAQPAPEMFTFTYYPRNTLVTPAYQSAVNDLAGAVNDRPITISGMSFDTGTLQLVRAQGGFRSNEDWQIEFGFGYRERVPERAWHTQPAWAGGQTLYVPEHSGYIYEWAYVALQLIDEEGQKSLSPNPYAMFLEQLWPEGDFRALNLPT